MLLNKKYNKLSPTKDYLVDEVILLNAWKKTQQYIRNVNWFVNYIELDKSAVELGSKIKSLKKQLNKHTLELKELKLIPAPKSQQWEFRTSITGSFSILDDKLSWYPVAPKEKKSFIFSPIIPLVQSVAPLSQPLRPLAHVSIDDQTLFTALMMLLADTVETIQGDPSTEFDGVHEKKVINYGNRLHCKYLDDKATYSWGNSDTYSKFFQDYQRFLARPIYFGKEANRTKTSDEEIYEVHLDFAKFYDLINRELLINYISKLIKNSTGNKPDETIQCVLDKFLDWKWSSASLELYKSVCRSEDVPELQSKTGIPQGLVSGGFLANIYMLEFDRLMFGLIGKSLSEDADIILIDACRYVDDFRLIIKVPKRKYTEDSLKGFVTQSLNPYTDKLGLKLQPKKTKLKKFSAREGSISTKLAGIQSKISGPMPLSELDEQLGHLEGLIELSDSLDDEESNGHNTNALASIDKNFNDVRKDTLLRFTANKIHYLLRQKRNMISQEVNADGKPISGSWDYLQERMARKLISKWTKDPSLVILMKKGLELFPHINLLQPILNNLDDVRKRANHPDQVQFAEYCLSEILRHSATAIHTKDQWAFPAHSDTAGYFEFLENYITEMLLKYDELSDSLREQVLFFCLVRNDSALDKEIGDNTFRVITKLMSGYRHIDNNMTKGEFTTSVLLAYQLSLDKRKVIRSVVSCLEHAYKNISTSSNKLEKCNILHVCKKIMLGNADLFESIYLSAKRNKLKWHYEVTELVSYLGINNYSKITGNISYHDGKDISLISVIRMDNNPFKHENGILKLLEATLVQFNESTFDRPIDITKCKINCSEWNSLLKLDKSCELSIEVGYYQEDEQYHKPPKWLTKDHAPLYYLGMFIRSCLLGSIDWSCSISSSTETPSYRGIKSNMLKRQIGMMHSPEAFGNTKSPMSSWLSSLLFKLLQWPGVEGVDNNYSWPVVWNLSELNKLITNRIVSQTEKFCLFSNIPTYTEKVTLGWSKEKQNLNVVMVQPLLPLQEDFTRFGLQLNTPKYRAKHRRHVASVAELVLHNISSVDSASEKSEVKGKVDLIIWPELSVSPDDLDVLERLSDKTGAIIFVGISFSHIDNKIDLNNSAMWIIPNKQKSGRKFIKRLQGKYNMTVGEKGLIEPWRPYQLIIELIHPAFNNEEEGFKLTGSICYDATDIKLSADLKDKSDAYIISAMNKDIATFDTMVDALFYHMYQPIILVNSGEFGGSVAKAPYKERYDKLITHVHGSHQVSISSFELNMFDFRNLRDSYKSKKETKTPPAGNKE